MGKYMKVILKKLRGPYQHEQAFAKSVLHH